MRGTGRCRISIGDEKYRVSGGGTPLAKGDTWVGARPSPEKNEFFA